MTPCCQSPGQLIMPALITDSAQLATADPFAPAFMMNTARIVSRLTRKPAGGKIVAVLRPCEIRAFRELVKLKQASPDELLIVGCDCPGALTNKDFQRIAGKNSENLGRRFLEQVLSQNAVEFEQAPIARACRACEFPLLSGADIMIGLFGVDVKSRLLAQSQTPAGDDLLKALSLAEAEDPPERKAAVGRVIADRIAYRDLMFREIAAQVNHLDKLANWFGACVNCYNCRVACPVCYCRECVFNTDAFEHDPFQYLQWATRKGRVKLPTDTVFYHLTRLAHISTACVGCGQCSNACPNDIPVMEVFRLTAQRAQAAFDYEAGRSLEEPPPLSAFAEHEFADIVGIALLKTALASSGKTPKR